jgi:hypothetical protein
MAAYSFADTELERIKSRSLDQLVGLDKFKSCIS